MENIIAEIDKEIRQLELELENVKGTETEVYTRIVGYHRAVANWNKGKKEEYKHRVCFDIDKSIKNEKINKIFENKITEKINADKVINLDVSNYIFFYSQYCRNCKPIKDYLQSINMNVEMVDVGTELGLNIAKNYGVVETPTILLLDRNNKEIIRFNNIKDLEAHIKAKELQYEDVAV